MLNAASLELSRNAGNGTYNSSITVSMPLGSAAPDESPYFIFSEHTTQPGVQVVPVTTSNRADPDKQASTRCLGEPLYPVIWF